MNTQYIPEQSVLDAYARLMVGYSVAQGKGVEAGEVVLLNFGQNATQFALALQKQVLLAGAWAEFASPIPGWGRQELLYANQKLLKKLMPHWRALYKEANHILAVDPNRDPMEFEGTDETRRAMRAKKWNPLMKILNKREAAGDMSWTICWYPTQTEATVAELPIEELWDIVIKSCYLDREDPVAQWAATNARINQFKGFLNGLGDVELHFVGPSADLKMRIGQARLWDGADPINMPSFEAFTTPDYRTVNGWAKFNCPILDDGTRIQGVYVRYENGMLVEWDAEQGQDHLAESLKTEQGRRVGEIAMTDSSVSPITKFTGNLLFDENRAGWHMALGAGYPQYCFNGPKNKAQWQPLGFADNDYDYHYDLVSNDPIEVYANGRLIFDGKFLI